MANIFTQNPMRVDTVMASDYLTTIGASAGLERPIKVHKLNIENAGAAVTAGNLVVQDGSTANNVLYEQPFAAVAVGTAVNQTVDFDTSPIWRTFKVSSIPAGIVLWIYRR